VRFGDIEAVKLLFEHGADPYDTREEYHGIKNIQNETSSELELQRMISSTSNV